MERKRNWKTVGGLHYREVGNPPISPSLFYNGCRIAWWPAGEPIDDQKASRVLGYYLGNGARILQHSDVLRILAR